MLTVANRQHVAALSGWHGRVIVKLESSMHRYGDGIELVEHAQSAGLRTVGVAIHPPLAGSEDDHRDDIVSRLPDIDPSLDVWVSHLAPATYAALPAHTATSFASGPTCGWATARRSTSKPTCSTPAR